MLSRAEIAERLVMLDIVLIGYALPEADTEQLKQEREALETAHELYDLLREFITPPLAYSKKQDAVAKARVLLEEWKEV